MLRNSGETELKSGFGPAGWILAGLSFVVNAGLPARSPGW